MSERNNDDVARALEALSAGEHQEDPAHDSHPPAPAPPPPAQPRPAARAAAAVRATAPTAAKPQPSRTAPAASAGTPSSSQSVASPRASSPAPRPPAPAAARPAGPASRPTTPQTFTRPAAPAASPAAPSTESAAVDDDAVIVPAPDASVFLHKPHYASKAKPKPFGQSIQFRQTLIPVLLTAGFIMITLGVLHFVWSGENNPLSDLPGWLLAVLFLFGAMLWGLAAANMLSVKSAIEAQQRQRKPAN
jgi:hypothetical protein